jgi:hypothetical protein
VAPPTIRLPATEGCAQGSRAHPPVLGSEPATFANVLSPPIRSRVTVGLVDEVVRDGPGDDISITEVGPNGELAEVFARSGAGTWTLPGIADDRGATSFDLASVGFKGVVTEITIVGLDSKGGSPGFDGVNVRVLPGAREDLSGNNSLEGSDRPDVIRLRAGNDSFDGRGRNDLIFDGSGNDTRRDRRATTRSTGRRQRRAGRRCRQ